MVAENYLNNVISPLLNIDFMFSEVVSDASALTAFIENAYAAGCVGVINTAGSNVQAAQAANDLGMYVVNNSTKYEEDVKALPYYLSNTGTSATLNSEAYSQALDETLKSGEKHNVLVLTGAASLGSTSMVEAAKGILNGLKDKYSLTYSKDVAELAVVDAQTDVETGTDMKVTIFPGVPRGADYASAVSSILQTGTYDVVISTISAYSYLSVAMDEVEKAKNMILFFMDPEEDLKNMKEAYHSGIITEERLNDALHHILGLKAKLGLNHLSFPAKNGLSVIGSAEHHALAAKAAEASITLVKDTQHILPLDPKKQHHIKLVYLEQAPVSYRDGHDRTKDVLLAELEKAGFEVSTEPDFYELEMDHSSPVNNYRMMDKGTAADFRNKYDAVIMAVNMKGYAQTNNVRLSYSIGHSKEIPWYVTEVPTICVSLNYTNHLFDVPMMKTFINAYSSAPEYVHAVVEKISGRSPFRGQYEDTVWCGRWDTKL